MGHIAFAAPGIDRYHLHERLGRELQQAGHRVQVLCVEEGAHTFWRHQGAAAVHVAERAPDPMRAPLGELAARECKRLGLSPGDAAWVLWHGRCHDRLARLVPSLVRWFEDARPDLVLLHRERTAVHALVHFVARELGVRVLWTSDGLLPHTLQVDERGVDGDASACRRPLADYRVVRREASLLDACLTNLLARTAPAALTRAEVHAPPLIARCRDAMHAALRDGWREAMAGLFGWRAALGPGDQPPAAPFKLPPAPYVALLLQDPREDRVRLDCDAPPSHRDLIAAAAAATAQLEPSLSLLVVVPPHGIDHRDVPDLAQPRLAFAPARAAPEVAATALATITVNHPIASAGLLAGTPVIHTGRALYGVRGATTTATTAMLGPALHQALAKDHPALRARYLSWLFAHGHLWCSPTDPDHNGLVGLVQAIEARLRSGTPGTGRLPYRAGPAWPLAAEGRGH